MPQTGAPPGEAAEVADDTEEDFLGNILSVFAATQAGSDIPVHTREVVFVQGRESILRAALSSLHERALVEFGCTLLD